MTGEQLDGMDCHSEGESYQQRSCWNEVQHGNKASRGYPDQVGWNFTQIWQIHLLARCKIYCQCKWSRHFCTVTVQSWSGDAVLVQHLGNITNQSMLVDSHSDEQRQSRWGASGSIVTIVCSSPRAANPMAHASICPEHACQQSPEIMTILFVSVSSFQLKLSNGIGDEANIFKFLGL